MKPKQAFRHRWLISLGAIRGKTIDYQSSAMEIQHRCYMCYLPMPFSKRARLVLANDSDQDYKTNMAYGIDYELDREVRDGEEPLALHVAEKQSCAGRVQSLSTT